MDVLLNSLLSTAFLPDAYDTESNVTLSSFFGICSLLENSASDTKVFISSFFSNLYMAMENTLDSRNFKSKEVQYNYQSYIASAIESAIVSEKLTLNKEQIKAIVDILIKTFQIRESVYEEGLLAISAIALGKTFFLISI